MRLGLEHGRRRPGDARPREHARLRELEIAPQGSEKQAFDEAFGRLLGADPEAQLGRAFTEAAQTGGNLDYEADVKPWLGDTISAVLTRAGRETADYALLVASTDDDKARAAIDKDLAGAHRPTSVPRRRLQGDGRRHRQWRRRPFPRRGTEPAFKAVVDVSKDGKSLADSEQWKTSVGNRAEGKAGLAYLDVKACFSRWRRSCRRTAPRRAAAARPGPDPSVRRDARCNPESLVVDVSSPGTKADPRGPGAASSPLIENLPADSWLASRCRTSATRLARWPMRSRPIL